MSRIWDSLKHVEQRETAQRPTDDTQWKSLLVERLKSLRVERRCGERRQICLPVFVYGHSADGEPFHESTEVLRANDSGGLITLQAAVTPGDKLLLTIRPYGKDQECHVVGVRSTYLNRSGVAVAFRKPLVDA